MDVIDHIANRVTAAALSGLIFGASLAIYRGLPIPRTALSAAASCALTGTACFASERAAHFALAQIPIPPSSSCSGDDLPCAPSVDRGFSNVYASHALGGMAGGSISGGLFQGRPVPGVLVFTPLMLAVAHLEVRIEQYRERRIRELLQQSSREEDRNGSHIEEGK